MVTLNPCWSSATNVAPKLQFDSEASIPENGQMKTARVAQKMALSGLHIFLFAL
eukprot:m.100525 g.100525  ORF g.100525 m.100525 type:complete len:54 (-) comp12491_c0_seq2:130-291(-)